MPKKKAASQPAPKPPTTAKLKELQRRLANALIDTIHKVMHKDGERLVGSAFFDDDMFEDWWQDLVEDVEDVMRDFLDAAKDDLADLREAKTRRK